MCFTESSSIDLHPSPSSSTGFPLKKKGPVLARARRRRWTHCFTPLVDALLLLHGSTHPPWEVSFFTSPLYASSSTRTAPPHGSRPATPPPGATPPTSPSWNRALTLSIGEAWSCFGIHSRANKKLAPPLAITVLCPAQAPRAVAGETGDLAPSLPPALRHC